MDLGYIATHGQLRPNIEVTKKIGAKEKNLFSFLGKGLDDNTLEVFSDFGLFLIGFGCFLHYLFEVNSDWRYARSVKEYSDFLVSGYMCLAPQGLC